MRLAAECSWTCFQVCRLHHAQGWPAPRSGVRCWHAAQLACEDWEIGIARERRDALHFCCVFILLCTAGAQLGLLAGVGGKRERGCVFLDALPGVPPPLPCPRLARTLFWRKMLAHSLACLQGLGVCVGGDLILACNTCAQLGLPARRQEIESSSERRNALHFCCVLFLARSSACLQGSRVCVRGM